MALQVGRADEKSNSTTTKKKKIKMRILTSAPQRFTTTRRAKEIKRALESIGKSVSTRN